ncbi:UNVERIFIED_CONTAM: hypothetical protein K2H54_055828 [Gekko kuhli]
MCIAISVGMKHGMEIYSALDRTEDGIPVGKGIMTPRNNGSTTRIEFDDCTETRVDVEAMAGVSTNRSLDLCKFFSFSVSRDEAESHLDCLSGLCFGAPEAEDAVDLSESPLGVGGGGKALELEDWDITGRTGYKEQNASALI